ncbi:hypothetical protein NMY22_g16697 [Coprinellus aureogranulatus]|nr:hypothetical protein NMY22_g16697 [Coprinellus aureogranulatus]
MAPRYERTLRDIPKLHPGIKKQSALSFLVIDPSSQEQNNQPKHYWSISAAEVATCIEYNQALCKGITDSNRKPSPIVYNDFSLFFNNECWGDERKFARHNNDGSIDASGKPPRFDDFGIQKEHRGVLVCADDVYTNPVKRRFLDKQLWKAALGNNSNKRPHKQSTASGVGSSKG